MCCLRIDHQIKLYCIFKPRKDTIHDIWQSYDIIYQRHNEHVSVCVSVCVSCVGLTHESFHMHQMQNNKIMRCKSDMKPLSEQIY